MPNERTAAEAAGSHVDRGAANGAFGSHQARVLLAPRSNGRVDVLFLLQTLF